MSRILAAAIIHGGGPAQDLLDAAPDPGGRFRLAGPDRLQHLEHILDGDLVDRLPAEHRIDVEADGTGPLLGVLVALPAGALRLNVAPAHVAKVGDLALGLAAFFAAARSPSGSTPSRMRTRSRSASSLARLSGTSRAAPSPSQVVLPLRS